MYPFTEVGTRELRFISELDVAKEKIAYLKVEAAVAMELIVAALLVIVALVFVGIAIDAARYSKGRG